MARNRKNVVNRIVEEPIKPKEEVFEDEPMVIDGKLLTSEPETEDIGENKSMTLEELVEQEEYLLEVPDEEPKLVFVNDPIEIDLSSKEEIVEEKDPSYEEKLARFLNNKTSSPYRLYLRTGIIPKL